MPPRAPALPLPPVPLSPGPGPGRRAGRPPRADAKRTTLTIAERAKRLAIAEAARRGVDLGTVATECIEAMLGSGAGEGRAA